MDTSKVYLNLKASRTPGAQRASPPCLPPDACQRPRSHRWALKLSCAGLILLLLTLIGMSVLDSPAKLSCSRDWLLHRDKCIHFSQDSHIWKRGLADCATKGATFLLIRDQEELSFIKASANEKGTTFWLGLYYTLPDKKWKWVNGSTLSSHGLQITGEAKKDSCAAVSKNKVFSDACASHNMWICQKEPKLVSEIVCNDS